MRKPGRSTSGRREKHPANDLRDVIMHARFAARSAYGSCPPLSPPKLERPHPRRPWVRSAVFRNRLFVPSLPISISFRKPLCGYSDGDYRVDQYTY